MRLPTMLKTHTLPGRSAARLAALALAAFLSAFLSGCATVAPTSRLPQWQARHSARLPAAEGLPTAAAQPGRAWWEDLQDPMLDQLQAQALARNPGLQAALATVREARAMAGLASREAGPQGGLGLSAQAKRPSSPDVDPYRQGLPRAPELRLIGLGQSLSWELDLFGRVGTAQAVAERERDMAQADLHGAQALLQAEVARRYIQLRAAQQIEALALRQLALAAARQAQLEARAAAGLADAREVRAAEADQAQRQAMGAAAAAQIHQALAALALLTGHSPAELDGPLTGLRAPLALPAVPGQQRLAVPEDVLQRLPHVARADAALRASLGQEVLAQRAHLPRLSLAATLGLNESPGRLGRSGALGYAAGPILQWDWLDWGRRSAREAAAQAGSERAWAQFEQAVLQSLADGESALRGWNAQYVGWQQSRRALAAAGEAARYAAERQALGLEPPLSAMTAEAQRLGAEQAATEQQALALQAYVQVQLALGAWQP